jgi:hypothetical protein
VARMLDLFRTHGSIAAAIIAPPFACTAGSVYWPENHGHECTVLLTRLVLSWQLSAHMPRAYELALCAVVCGPHNRKCYWCESHSSKSSPT